MSKFDFKSRLPIPMGFDTECKRGARIIEAFLKPGGLGTDKLIPPSILEKARGIAFLSVIKAGFVWSGRLGSGLVVARLPNGQWSAPSAISIGGAGVGGQVGGELTDFVMVLTTPDAVKAFSHGGNLTLGANVGIAAGPFGRSAEASGAVRNLAPVLSYSRTKGLFIGVSLEGSVIIERKGTNKEAYGRAVRPDELLNGSIPPPPSADVLFRALNLRIPPLSTSGSGYGSTPVGDTTGPYGATSFYGDSAYGSAANVGAGAAGAAAGPSHNPVSSNFTPTGNYGSGGASGSGGAGGDAPSYLHRSITETSHHSGSNYGGTSQYGKEPERAGYPPHRSDDAYGAAPAYSEVDGSHAGGNTDYYSAPTGDVKQAHRPPPPIPTKSRPQNNDGGTRVVAKYDFEPQADGDLGFKKGDIIIVLEKRGGVDSWWKGSCNGRQGEFPANYLEETSLENQESNQSPSRPAYGGGY
ncbi:hypothetical protein GGF46_000560 [Coemansia sp. RSA 552]|nr:hypothetical protein GGF46_000560 [Coemansia sp. RSA 552]